MQAEIGMPPMHFSKTLLRACLLAGQWLFVLTGALALASLVSDFLRSDAAGRPAVMAGIGIGCFALAGMFGLIRRFLDARPSDGP
jgi:hypothetical protein